MKRYSRRKALPHVRVLDSASTVGSPQRSPRPLRPAAFSRSIINRATKRRRAKDDVAPYGLLTGLRRYLVARQQDDPVGRVRLYVVEKIKDAEVSNEPFERDPTFNLQAFANRAFGVFQNEEEFVEVVWRFGSRAAAHARGFEFHPGQTLEDQADGSLIVRFSAVGHLEMCWHLYLRGDQVEVLAPERLRQMVEGYRRSDFPSLP